MRYRSIFIQALSVMHGEFTSGDFVKECRRLGLPRDATKTGIAAEFLHQYCDQIEGTRRSWIKRSEKALVPQAPQPGEYIHEITEEQAIERLKRSGCYEIYKTEKTKLV